MIKNGVGIKLMQLGLQNQIVDDSDFKPSKIDHQFRSDSDNNDEIVLLITILIYIRLIWSFSIYF